MANSLSDQSAVKPGLFYAALAYSAWGLFPLYFLQVAHIGAFEVVLHRTVWSLVFVLIVLLALKRWAWLLALRRQPSVVALFALSALLLSINWLTYVWAVHNQHVVDASLGYFILPLVNVALGYVVLGERPRRGQWAAVALAASGVLWLTLQTGRVPWIALVLAATFGGYGLLRKVAVLGALEGFALETLLLAPFAAGILGFWLWQGQGAMAQLAASPAATGPLVSMAWLLLAGPLTAVPLLLFAAGARRIPLTTMGILQFISPTLQLLLGVWVFHEPLPPVRLIGFALIWAALIAYSVEGLWFSRQRALQTAVI